MGSRQILSREACGSRVVVGVLGSAVSRLGLCSWEGCRAHSLEWLVATPATSSGEVCSMSRAKPKSAGALTIGQGLGGISCCNYVGRSGDYMTTDDFFIPAIREEKAPTESSTRRKCAAPETRNFNIARGQEAVASSENKVSWTCPSILGPLTSS